MKLGRKLAEAAAFSLVMIVIAYFDGSIVLTGAVRPLWFQLVTRFAIYAAIFFAVSLGVDALFSRREKK